MSGYRVNRKWVFADWKLPTADDFKLIKEMGFTDVVLGVQKKYVSGGFTEAVLGRKKVSAANQRFIDAAEKIKELGCRVHLMVWAVRDRKYLADMCDWLTDACVMADADSVILDAEGDWHKSKTKLSVSNAVSLIRKGLSFLNVGVTGLSNLHRTVKPLAKQADYVIPQAYSIWKPGDEDHWSHSDATRPYQQQLKSFKSWSKVEKPVVMGLSNYWVERPKYYRDTQTIWFDPKVILERSLRGATDAGAEEVAYWSLAWLRKSTKSAQAARDFTKSIKTSVDNFRVVPGKVASTQWLLVSLGYDLGDYGPQKNGIDGVYGPLTKDALQNFVGHDVDLRVEPLVDILVDLLNDYRTRRGELCLWKYAGCQA